MEKTLRINIQLFMPPMNTKAQCNAIPNYLQLQQLGQRSSFSFTIYIAFVAYKKESVSLLAFPL